MTSAAAICLRDARQKVWLLSIAPYREVRFGPSLTNRSTSLEVAQK